MKQTVRFIGVSRLESLRACISQIRFSVLHINSHEFAKMLFFVIGLIALPIDSFAGVDDFLWRAWRLHCDWHGLSPGQTSYESLRNCSSNGATFPLTHGLSTAFLHLACLKLLNEPSHKAC